MRIGKTTGRALLIVCVLATAAALVPFADWHLQRTGFWYDESMQFWMSMGGDGFDAPLTPPGTTMKALRSNAWGNLDPGGFTLLLRAWMSLVGEGAVWQRALPLLLFAVGMGALGVLGWTWRRSVPFAVLSGLVPVCFPMLLDYATEVRAYSMEFAGVCLGALATARLVDRPTVGRAFVAGTLFGVFLSSRYSFVLFTAAACACLVFFAATWRSGDRRALLAPALAFAAPMLALGALIAAVPVRMQYMLRISHDSGAHLRYLDPLTASGKSATELFGAAAANLLGPAALPATALAAIGALALVGAVWRRRQGPLRLATQTAAFGVLALATLAATALAWPWHPWDIGTKWNLYLQALSAVAIVRLAASVLSLAGDPAENGLERDWRLGALVLVGIVAFDMRFAVHRRPAGNTVVEALAYLEENAPLQGGVAVIGHWYPTVRYFYEYGRFHGSSNYPSAFNADYRDHAGPLIDSQTRFVISNMSVDTLRTIEPGVEFVDDPSLPPSLYRIAMPVTDSAGGSDAAQE